MNWYLESIETIVKLLGEVALIAVAYGSITRLPMRPVYRQVAYGLLFGAAAGFSLLSPIVFSNGVAVDGHYLMIAFAAAFGGPVTFAVTVVLAAAAKAGLQGGPDPGYFISLSTVGLLGLSWHYLIRPRWGLGLRSLLVLGVIITLQMLLFFLLPVAEAWPRLLNTLPAGLITCVLGSVLMGKFIEREMRHIRIELRLSQEALTDTLTGLPNRRAFEHDLVAFGGESSDFYAFIADIDHFKKLNDEFGHASGDVVLQRVGKAFSRSVASIGQAYRTGGEEFILLVRCRSLDAAIEEANRVRLAVEELSIEGISRAVTVSLGVAAFRDAEDPDRAIRLADQALYVAKAAGRNRVASTAQLELLSLSPLRKGAAA